MNILSLCDLTGHMVLPWINAGHDCWIVDLQHEENTIETFENGASLTRIKANVLDLVGRDGRSLCDWIQWDMIFAFPPCDHLAVSGARWFKEKGLSALVEALEIVESCRTICESSECPYMLENPVSTLATYWRKPDYSFDPWNFNNGRMSDTYWKTTCLWTGNGFHMPEHNVDPRTVEVMRLAEERYPHIRKRSDLIAAVKADADLDDRWFPDDRIHKCSPGPDRKNFRSATPNGFAEEVYAANCEFALTQERQLFQPTQNHLF